MVKLTVTTTTTTGATMRCLKKTGHFVTVRYLRQILTDFHNYFTLTLCIQFTITWLLNIPPHLKCATTLPCEIYISLKITMIRINTYANVPLGIVYIFAKY